MFWGLRFRSLGYKVWGLRFTIVGTSNMPPKVLSAVALMKKGARSSSSPSVGSRAEHSLGQLFGLQHLSVRRTEDMVAVLKSLALLFRHLEMPAGFPLLDVLLAVYMLW